MKLKHSVALALLVFLFGSLGCVIYWEESIIQKSTAKFLDDGGMRDIRGAVWRRAMTVPFMVARRGDFRGSLASLSYISKVHSASYFFSDPGHFFVFTGTNAQNVPLVDPDFVVTRSNGVWTAEWGGRVPWD